MTRMLAVLAALSLAALGARADDQKTESTTESHHAKDGTGKVKKEMKSKHDGSTAKKTEEHSMSKDMSGGTTETKDMKSEHNPKGGKHTKAERKETIKRDKNGNVVEKKDEAK